MNKKFITLKESKNSAEKYFRKYLQIAPLSVSLCRSIEAKNFATVTMKPPILDIGCGFGEFAQAFFEKKVDTGIDNSSSDLRSAEKVNKYKNLVLGDARHMSFNNNSFRTIISVSTVEHIKNSDKVFEEAYRVLMPNGLLVLTIETNKVDQSSIYRTLFKKIGIIPMTKLYIKTFNRVFHRNTILPKDAWEYKIENAGFIIEESREIVSSKIIMLFELFMITALPSQILKLIFGRRIVWRPKFIIDILTSVFLKHLDEEADGTVLFLVARKPKK